MKTTRQLTLAACVLVGTTAYMAYLGTTAGWQYYLSVPECLDHPAALVDQRVRVSGEIVAGTLQITPDHDWATFRMGQARQQLPVRCRGPLPDNLGEGMQVVVEGRLSDRGRLEGDRVLTRCASKYSAETELAQGSVRSEGNRR